MLRNAGQNQDLLDLCCATEIVNNTCLPTEPHIFEGLYAHFSDLNDDMKQHQITELIHRAGVEIYLSMVLEFCMNAKKILLDERLRTFNGM